MSNVNLSSFEYRGRLYKLRPALRVEVTENDDCVYATINDFWINECGKSRYRAVRNVRESVSCLYEEYCCAPDKSLSGKGLSIKKRLKEHVVSP